LCQTEQKVKQPFFAMADLKNFFAIANPNICYAMVMLNNFYAIAKPNISLGHGRAKHLCRPWLSQTTLYTSVVSHAVYILYFPASSDIFPMTQTEQHTDSRAI
jgi:hypothetical protein